MTEQGCFSSKLHVPRLHGAGGRGWSDRFVHLQGILRYGGALLLVARFTRRQARVVVRSLTGRLERLIRVSTSYRQRTQESTAHPQTSKTLPVRSRPLIRGNKARASHRQSCFSKSTAQMEVYPERALTWNKLECPEACLA